MQIETHHRRLVIALVLLTALAGTAASAAGPDRIADRYVKLYNAGDLDRLMEIYTPDVTFVDVSQRHEYGHEGLHHSLAQLAGMHKVMRVEEKRRATEGSLVTLEVAYTGTLDAAALGLSDHADFDYEVAAVLLFETEGGRIRSQTDYLDFRALSELQQSIQEAMDAGP